MNSPPQALPYLDTKPVGAAGFYTAINATFRFILGRFGKEGLLRYWEDIGSRYYRPVTERWSAGGLPAVAEYWRAFFVAEPGAEVEVQELAEHVEVKVLTCPMIAHLREQGREIVPCFCQHCYFVSDAIGRPAGVTVRVEGGAGSCVQRFYLATGAPAVQDMNLITEVRS